MAKVKNTRLLSGTSGEIWINGEEIANIQKIEIKITQNYDSVFVVGNYAEQHIYTGWSGSGSISLFKMDSTFLKLLGDAVKTGDMPEITIQTALTCKSTGKTERVRISEVSITELNLASFESNGKVTEEMPIKFSEYDILETISY